MTFYEFILINVNIVAFYLLYLVLERGEMHRIYNRIYLLLTPVLAIALPFVHFTNENSTIIRLQQLPEVQVLAKNEIISLNETFSTNLILYGAVTAIGLSLLIYRIIKITRKPSSKLIQRSGKLTIYELQENIPSYSFFNRIFINPQESNSTQAILEHEIAHAKQWHSVDTILAKIYESILWFNPLLRLYTKKIKLNHEYLADQEVLKTVDPESYSQTILQAALSTNIPVISSGFKSRSSTYNRIMKLNHKNTNHMKHLAIIPLALALGFMTVSMKDAPAPKGGIQSDIAIAQGETPAEFPGGSEAMSKFIMENIKYPKDLAQQNIEGKVFVEFTITKEGTVTNPVILRSSGHTAFDEESIRVVNLMPNWKPAQKSGATVESKMTLPFMFNLSDEPARVK